MEIARAREVGEGDTQSRGHKRVSEPPGFPWRTLVLCLVRLALVALHFHHGSQQMVIRTDGSTSTKKPFKRQRRPYQYEEVRTLIAIVLMDIFPEDFCMILTAISSIFLLVAIFVVFIWDTRFDQKYSLTDGEIDGGELRWCAAAVLLTTAALAWIIIDMTFRLPLGFHNLLTLLVNVGPVETLSYVMLYVTSHAFQMYLLFGGLDFQNSLFADDTTGEDLCDLM